MQSGVVQSPRGLRAKLRRWLFPEEASLLVSQPAAVPQPGPMPQAAPLGAGGSQERLAQAERCYTYAEQLNHQGAAEMATAFYRQAYVQLRPLVGLAGAPMGQQPVLPAQATPAAPAAAPATTPLQAKLEQLRRQLNPETAPAIQQQLLELQRQGQRDADLFNLLGLAALLQENNDQAQRWFAETLAVNPNHVRALINQGGLLLRADRNDEALELLARAVRLARPNSSEGLAALTNLTLAHEKVGRTADAAQLALRIFRIKPDHLRPESLQNMATILEEKGDDASAIEILRYLSEQGGSTTLKRHLAKLLERRGDFQQAAVLYRDLLAEPEAAGDRP